MIYDAVGLIGVSLVVIAYFLLQIEKVSIYDISYSILNIFGSTLILVSLCINFNLASAVIEGFWVLISFIGVVKYLKNKPTN
jgi:hypothetical protein